MSVSAYLSPSSDIACLFFLSLLVVRCGGGDLRLCINCKKKTCTEILLSFALL